MRTTKTRSKLGRTSERALGYSAEIGADGWPVDRNHPVNRPQRYAGATAAALAERRRRQDWQWLEIGAAADRREAVEAGLRYCAALQEPPPPWLIAAAARIMRRADASPPGRQGRLPNNAMHYERWAEIEDIRTRSGDVSLEDAIAKAVEYVRKFDGDSPAAGGGADAFRKSHRRVEKAIKDGRFGEFFRFPLPR